MFRGFKHSSRRAFLRGAGGMALGLPLLEYTHGNAWARSPNANLRFLTVFSHGGTLTNQEKSGRADGNGNHHGVDLWRPADPTSSALTLGPIHEPLEPFVDKLLLLEGIDNQAAISQDQYSAGAHGTANVTALTAADEHIVQNGDDESHRALGASIDQVVAERLAERQPVPFERIHLRVSGHQYGTPYFRAADEPVSGTSSPLEAFQTLFAGVSDDEEPSPAALRQIKMRTSALDGLMGSYSEIRGRVSANDKHAIDAHLDHLRALENELANPVVCSKPEGIDASDGPGDVIGSLHADLIVAALRCGLTNVANLEISDILTPWTPTGTPVPSAFDIGHSLHHYGRDVGPTGEHPNLHDDWVAEMLDNRKWRIGLMAQIVAGLDDPAFMEGDCTILDNSLVLYTSEFRNGSIHSAWNMPVLLAGSAGGYLQTGRFIDYNQHASEGPNTLNYATEETTHNLFTSILQAMGEGDTHFGNDAYVHQGPLPDLT